LAYFTHLVVNVDESALIVFCVLLPSALGVVRATVELRLKVNLFLRPHILNGPTHIANPDPDTVAGNFSA
jgi:hypothetical protein